MKKTYLRPNVAPIDLSVEDFIAESATLPISNDEQAAQWSQGKGGWNSDNWSNENAGEE